MENEKPKTCPRCNKKYIGYPALSRRDNKTNICSKCGTQEALFDFEIRKAKEVFAAITFKEYYAKERAWLNGGK